MDKPKLCINITTKNPSYKQIIIPMSENNINKFMVSSSNHISNLNYCCSNHLSQRQMITQAINLLSQISSRKFTRELNKEPLLN